MINLLHIFCILGLMGIPCIMLFLLAKQKMRGSLVCIVLWFVVMGTLYLQELSNVKKWNNGQCNCGSSWNFIEMDKNISGIIIRHYSCSKCENQIEIIH